MIFGKVVTTKYLAKFQSPTAVSWPKIIHPECISKLICKLLLKLKSSTPNYMIYGELGRFPIEIDIKIRMVSFWARHLLGKETKLSYFRPVSIGNL
jgi:hypothetical protein